MSTANEVERVETVPLNEVAKALGVSPRKAMRMILNGTLPVGCVAEPEEEGERYTPRVLKVRWEAYIAGKDLRAQS